MATQITDEIVMVGFHNFLKNALILAKAENLLDEETLSSAEADLMISGPALCLYLACLRSNSSPPSIPIPLADQPSQQPLELNERNCPAQFRGLLSVWAQSVPLVKALSVNQRRDLARLLCNKQVSSTQDVGTLKGLAAGLRAMAIEISQRRTFQERYREDLQAALDHAGPGSQASRNAPSRLATFVPPPDYPAREASPARSFTAPPPALPARRPRDSSRGREDLFNQSRPDSRRSSPIPVRLHRLAIDPRTVNGGPKRTKTKIIVESPLSITHPTVLAIREMLYAAIGNVVVRTPSIKRLLTSDPASAYFAAVGLGILDLSSRRTGANGAVNDALGHALHLSDIPLEYQMMMKELGEIGKTARQIEEEDSVRAVELMQEGHDDLPVPRMDRVKAMLSRGESRAEVDVDDLDSRRSSGAEGDSNVTVIQFANRINALHLAMIILPAFFDRKAGVLEILVGVSN